MNHTLNRFFTWHEVWHAGRVGHKTRYSVIRPLAIPSFILFVEVHVYE